MAYAENLRLKGTCYHFRKRIPYNLRRRIGRHEVVRSLDTSDCRVASRRARLIWLRLQRVLDWVAGDITITKAQIDAAMERFAASLDWADEIRLAHSGGVFEHRGDAPLGADALVLETIAHDHRDALARNDVSGVRKEIDHLRGEFESPLTNLDEQLLGRAILAALASSGERTAERLRASVYPHLHPEDETDAQAIQSPVPTKVGMSFKDAWDAAMADNMATRQWGKGKVAHAASTLKLWLGVHGDMDLADVTPHLAVEFRKMAAQLPERYHREKRWRDIPIRDIVAITITEERPDQAIGRVSKKTVNRHISTLKTTWERFQELHYAPRGVANPFDRLHIAVSKTTEDIQEERDQFTLDEVRTLFSSPIWQGCKSRGSRKKPGPLIIRDWRYWVPLIGAYTGMRREEICSFRIGDIENVEGVWIFNLRRAKRRYKTPGSSRYVPIHRHLLEWGLIDDLVDGRAADDWLLAELAPSTHDGKFGEKFGKWFTPLRRDLGIYRPEVVFHSFRHTVSTALNHAEAFPPFVEEVIGHESAERRSEIRRYTKPTLVRKLRDTIDKLDYGLVLPMPDASPRRRVRHR